MENMPLSLMLENAKGMMIGAFNQVQENTKLPVKTHERYIGGCLIFVPTRDSATYLAAIESWKEQMQKAA